MADVRNVLAAATRRLGDRIDAEALLLHVLDKPRSWLIAHDTDALEEQQLSAFEAMVSRRENGEPVAYITGRRGFWSMDLEVTPATLIPRPETELLVELALERLPADRPSRIVDLGTGSGAIALAIARERPLADVSAVDLSVEALAVARGNAKRLGLERVRFLHGTWMTPLSDERFDVIVSNPPYIEAADPHLGQGDLRFEPAAALASGADGLEAIREIVAHAPRHLVPGGWLLMEHGWNQGPAVRGLLERTGYAGVFTAPDLEGRDRVSGGHR